MTPLGCLDSTPPFCVLIIGNVGIVPVLQHAGKYSDGRPGAAFNCTEFIGNSELDDENHPCHQFRFMLSLFFFNTIDTTPLFDLLFRYSADSTNIFDAFYHAAYGTSVFAQGAFASENTTNLYSSVAWRRQAFDFCQNNCTTMVISFYDLPFSLAGKAISPYYYRLTKGACMDSISQDASAL